MMYDAINKLKQQLEKLHRGGKLFLPVGEYSIEETIVIDTPCVKLSGEVWNYSTDPNGVFESKYGTKLRMKTRGIPALMMSHEHVLGGNVVSDIGICGNITGMDTRGMFCFERPKASAGLYFAKQRVDQAQFSKISFCGLASAVCAEEDAEIDACIFENLNTDGCCIGFYFAPRASFYTSFRSCVVADTPSYGFFLNGEGRMIHHADISDMKFVRNGGAFGRTPYPKAAVCFYEVSDCSVSNCIFDFPGTFWYYDEKASSNEEREIIKNPVPALWIQGNKNRVRDNVFSHSSSDTLVVCGDENIIMNNVIDKNIVISGKGNVLSGNVFTSRDAKIILTKEASDTQLINVEEERIVRL